MGLWGQKGSHFGFIISSLLAFGLLSCIDESDSPGEQSAVSNVLEPTVQMLPMSSYDREPLTIQRLPGLDVAEIGNPVQGLRGEFSKKGLSLRPSLKTAVRESQWNLDISLSSFGRDDLVAVPQAVALHTEGARVDFERPEITEWFVNTDRGIQHGFDVHTRPSGDGELTVDVRFEGLSPEVVDSQTALLRSPDGTRTLTYSEVVAWDSTGKPLAARMQAGGVDIVSLVVDDRHAVYPITIDPWIETDKLSASDGTGGEFFGGAVYVSGDIAVVGSAGNSDAGPSSGAAYISARDPGEDTWSEVTRLMPSDVTEGDEFGRVVSIHGDYAIVGAPLDDENSTNSGAAYIFERNEGGVDNWGEAIKLAPVDVTEQARFGVSVAVNGDTALVGAPFDSNPTNNAGSVYVFVRDSMGNWEEVAKLIASDPQIDASFGSSVAIDAGVAVVGANYASAAGNFAGAAYVFEQDRGGVNAWGEVTKFMPDDASASDAFGVSVSLSGDIAAVGTLLGTTSTTGAAYLFDKDEGGVDNWGQISKLTTAGPVEGDQFGRVVSIDGDSVVVGANYDSELFGLAGAAYVFSRNEGGADAWGIAAKLMASDADNTDQLGGSVSISGNVVFAGAERANPAGPLSGAAYVFTFRDNTAPVAMDDEAMVDAGESVIIDVLANDTDADGDALSIESVGTPSDGTASESGGEITYTPAAGFSGTDSFTYTISDVFGESDTATVTVVVNEVVVAPTNEPPVAVDSAVSTDVNTAVAIVLSATDPDGDALTYTVTTPPTNGSISGTAPDLTYTPDTDYAGTDELVFEVSDGEEVDTATVSITVVAATPTAERGSSDDGGCSAVGSGGSGSLPIPLLFMLVFWAAMRRNTTARGTQGGFFGWVVCVVTLLAFGLSSIRGRTFQ